MVTFPDGEDVVQDLPDRHPLLPHHWLSVLIIQVDTIHELAIDVELLVKRGTVADADGCAASVS